VFLNLNCVCTFLGSCPKRIPEPGRKQCSCLQTISRDRRAPGTRVRYNFGLFVPPVLLFMCHVLPNCLYGLRYLPKVPSFLWLSAWSSLLCCCSWLAVVSEWLDTSWRKPDRSPQRSQITSSTACTCSQSARRFEKEEHGCRRQSLRRNFWNLHAVFLAAHCLSFVLMSGWKHPESSLSESHHPEPRLVHPLPLKPSTHI